MLALSPLSHLVGTAENSRTALDDAAAAAAAIAPFQVGQAVRKIHSTKNTEQGATRIVSKVHAAGWCEFVGAKRIQNMADFMLDV